jgi:hypothetical protein
VGGEMAACGWTAPRTIHSSMPTPLRTTLRRDHNIDHPENYFNLAYITTSVICSTPSVFNLVYEVFETVQYILKVIDFFSLNIERFRISGDINV